MRRFAEPKSADVHSLRIEQSHLGPQNAGSNMAGAGLRVLVLEVVTASCALVVQAGPLPLPGQPDVRELNIYSVVAISGKPAHD
jgi:hypothetical protein